MSETEPILRWAWNQANNNAPSLKRVKAHNQQRFVHFFLFDYLVLTLFTELQTLKRVSVRAYL